MSDDSAAGTAAPRPKKDEVIEDAVVVDEPTTPVVVEEATVTETEPVIATDDPASAEVPAAEPAHRVVYVQVPAAPRKLGNRGIGSLIAIGAAVVFIAILALITAVIGVASTRSLSFGFLGRADFYIPALFFLIAFVLLVLIVNRGNWWAYIVGSVLVGVVVYFGTIGLGLLTDGVVLMTPDEASQRFREYLGSPFVIVSALLAREVALWTGGIISRRGRRLRARNAENREAYERELATTRAEHERAAAATPAA
jgi:hypothetical protein